MTADDRGDWLGERLFDNRIVLCRGLLDDVLVGRVAAELMTLDALGDGAVSLHLDSAGATLEAAWSLIDVIDLLGVPVNVTCAGRVEGAAVGILAAATRRIALPHARFRLCDPELEVAGNARELKASIDYHRDRLDRLHERVAASLRRPTAEVAADFRSGRYLDAEQALAYRLIDEIAGSDRKLRPIGGRPRALPGDDATSANGRRTLGFDPGPRPASS